MKKYIVGVDIGGTKIASGLVSQEGRLIKKTVFPTFSEKGADFSLGQVYSSIEQIVKISGLTMSSVDGIGVCAPGPLDPIKGVVHNPPNLKGWKDIPLAALLRKKFKTEVRIENDANAAGMAELEWGAAKSYRHVLYVTVSTGIGTAVIIDGKIYHGKNGMAGEGGHVSIDYKDLSSPCNCGNYGCIEALASGAYTAKKLAGKIREGSVSGSSGIIRECGGDISKLDMEIIGRAASKGNRLAISTIEEEGRLIGIWLGGMISILDPEIIVIGGGVALLGGMLFREIKKSIPAHTINEYASKTPVVPAKLKKDVGIYGAASIMLRKTNVVKSGRKRKS
jgi:glucokinase